MLSSSTLKHQTKVVLINNEVYTDERGKERSALLPKPAGDLFISLHVGICGTSAK
jgi:hypothetical protein